MLTANLVLADAAATERFGRNLAAALRAVDPGQPTGACIYLRGDLGAGKTTLTRGILRGYGFGGAVKSPTYTLVEPYELPEGSLYHFDLYRLNDPAEVEFLGIGDYFHGDSVCVIEWPEHGKSAIPGPDLDIELRHQGRGRQLSWTAGTPRGMAIAERLLSRCRNL
ncbi:MAG: tRNA ((37)-N6)-threonylcarbamoyltransferase complex ATPase subunit type 1 TsaE [Pseudomonadota bacterium]|jgi:tRNA threonylcarbamoyladenosine biosynthesis protein TsaE